MKIKTHLYTVELKEVMRPIKTDGGPQGKKRRNLPPTMEPVRELHEVEDLGFSDEVVEVIDNQDLTMLTKQLGMDNQAHERMLCRIRKVGEQFQLRVKILTND